MSKLIGFSVRLIVGNPFKSEIRLDLFNCVSKRLLGMRNVGPENNLHFSVITTIHDSNRLPYFERQLCSILVSLGETDELIIVNQIGEKNLEHFDLLKDPRVRIVTSGSMKSSEARNYGLKFVRKNYVIFFDDDNFMNRFHLSFARSAIQKWGTYDVWYFGSISDFTKFCITYFPFDVQALLRWNLADTNTLIFRSKIFSDGIRWDEGLSGCEDWEIVTQCVIKGLKIKSVPIFSVFLTSDAPNRVSDNHNKKDSIQYVKNKLENHLRSRFDEGN